MNISSTPPPQLTPEQIAEFTALCDELGDATEDRDRNRVSLILTRITDIHPALATFMTEGLAGAGFASLSQRIGDGDLQAYAAVRRIAGQFGPEDQR